MATGRLTRFRASGARLESVLRILLCVLLLVSLYLLSVATQDSETFGRFHPWLLAFNSVCLVGLLVLIATNLWRLIRQRRQGQLGSRLTMRLVSMFVVLAVVPVSVVYYFSIQFLDRGIDSWFDQRTEQQAVEDALNLSQASFEARQREFLGRMEAAAASLGDVPDSVAPTVLDRIRREEGVAELTLMSPSGRIIATSAAEPGAAILPHRPEDDILLQVRMGRPYLGLDPIDDTGLHIRILVPAPGAHGAPGRRILQALYPVSPRVNALAASVQNAYARYQEMGYLSRPLQETFTITLSLVLLLSLLFAVWSAFYAARKLVEPVRSLAEGTAAVAAGDYGKQLPPTGGDELGFLVRSFNDMSRRVAQARDEAKHSQAQVESQRAYLEAVLGRLSSGVLALDTDGTIRTWNRAAEQILGVSLRTFSGKPLAVLTEHQPNLEPFVAMVGRLMAGGPAEWREEVTLFGGSGRQMLSCSGASLPGGGGAGGYVIVIDDVTELVQAQRDAAWGEVARRLAHEIKNPLTPIQLSAERLRRRLSGTLEGRDGEVLDRATDTIIHQVEAMKAMVNAFNEYARPPRLEFAEVDLNGLMRQVVELYRAGPERPVIHLELDEDLPPIRADHGRLRQLLHNLVKNALEATPTDVRSELTLGTRLVDEAQFRGLEFWVRDRGPGFSEEVMDHLFEPYVTTKARGTGLGMPIVKKIVEEHNGQIMAENAADGASVTICLPMPDVRGKRPASGEGGGAVV